MIEPEPFYADPTFWVAIAFAIFVAALLYLKVHRRLIDMLDGRSERIRKELDDARELREEAQALLASLQRKQRDAERDAEDIITQATEEAVRMAEQAREDLAKSAERATELAREKIAQAEAAAVGEVREAAIDVAVASAFKVVKDHMDADQGSNAIEESIADLEKNLH